MKASFDGGVIFHVASDPLSVFRLALAASIRSIESHPRGRLLQEFLRKGPYEGEGDIPPELRDSRLSDDATAEAICFIYHHMVNSFKGAVTEMLAAAPCLRVLQHVQREGNLPPDARLYAGDSVAVTTTHGSELQKGADFHILVENIGATPKPIIIAGVAEVKSYSPSLRVVEAQIDTHIVRIARGLRVGATDYPSESICVGLGKNHRVLRIVIVPDTWRLPRAYDFETGERGRILCVKPPVLPRTTDQISRLTEDRWQITLKWSMEAITSYAHDMTFWYMKKVGEAIYSDGVPKAWSYMTRAEAGRNASKMMLYYAILRCRDVYEEQRAISLYNSYSFGYALGANFKDKNGRGRRRMLWLEDLDEILQFGRTKGDCRIR